MVLRNRQARLVPRILMLLLILVTTACGQAGSKPGAAPPAGDAQKKPLQNVSLVLDWYPNAVHAFLYVAEKEGYFAQEGLKVQFKMPAADPTDGIKLVGAGKETLALYYQPDVLVARQNGVPIVSLGAVVRSPLNHPMAPAQGGITSPKDLAGKNVGYPGIPMNEGLVRTMVKKDGGDPSKVKFIDVGFDLVPAIATRKVPAISGGYINHEKILLEKQGVAMVSFDPTQYGVPAYYELVLVAGEDTVRKDQALIQAFWRAAAKGFARTKADPGGSLAVLLAHEASEFKLERDVEEKSLQVLLPLMDEGGKATFGSQDRARWDEVSRWMLEIGLLKQAPAVDAAFVNVVK